MALPLCYSKNMTYLMLAIMLMKTQEKQEPREWTLVGFGCLTLASPRILAERRRAPSNWIQNPNCTTTVIVAVGTFTWSTSNPGYESKGARRPMRSTCPAPVIASSAPGKHPIVSFSLDHPAASHPRVRSCRCPRGRLATTALNSGARFGRPILRAVRKPSLPASIAALGPSQLLQGTAGCLHGLLLMATKVVVGLLHIVHGGLKSFDGVVDVRTMIRHWHCQTCGDRGSHGYGRRDRLCFRAHREDREAQNGQQRCNSNDVSFHFSSEIWL